VCCAYRRWPASAAPWWDAHATASFIGMTLSSGRGHLVRALLEGIAAQVAALAELVADDLGQPLHRLRVDGGLTRSAVLMQSPGRPGPHPPSRSTRPRMPPRSGRLRAPAWPWNPAVSLTEVVGTWTPQHTYKPLWSADRAAEHLQRWKHAATAALAPVETHS